ncbi:hypothetical protein [Bermanella sp. R86510]|uniref:hypothetical protein n=1 Tax=unclassified Bermanella TaxID=2627862 RepID=UPI0037C95A49
MSKAQSLIEQFYQEEQEQKAQEATFTPLDLSVSSADMAMINIISKRFNKDKTVLVREALSQALVDMFNALEPVERKMLGKDADELANSIAQEIAEEQGLESLEVTGTNWVAQDKQAAKDERKAEKAEQQARERLEEEIEARLKADLEAPSGDTPAMDNQPEQTETLAEASNEFDSETENTEEANSFADAENEERNEETEQNSIFA